eukprot:gene29567-36255_t
MIPMTLSRIAEIVGGTLHDVDDSSTQVTGTVEFDSRKVAPAAVAAGAVAVLAARPVGVPAIVVPSVPNDGPSAVMLLEHDTDGSGAAVLHALGLLARAVVDELATDGTPADGGLTLVGVTGSAGKTSTKDLIAALLRECGEVVAPPGSFNNELGLPWTVLRADEKTRFLVLEMSARGVGHVGELTKIAPPKIGVVLNVGTAHLGEFGSREAIAVAKGELVEALPSAADGGVAVLNADDRMVAAMASRTKARIVFVGQSEDCDVRATDVVVDDQARASFTLNCSQGSARIRLAVHGEHHVSNALAAAAVALENGLAVADIARVLEGTKAASARRMEVTERADGVTVVNDSYNANPDSMRAALKAWAVLGEMGELGPESVVEHDAIGRLAVRLDVSKLIVVGTGRTSRAMHQGAVMEGSWGDESVVVPDAAAAIAILEAELEPGDLVLVKASKSVELWTVAEAILAATPNTDSENTDGENGGDSQ